MIRAYQADAEHKKQLSVRAMSRVLSVSKSGYYDWCDRAPSARSVANDALAERIGAIHAMSHFTYGALRIHAELRDVETATHDPRWAKVGKHRVARLMRSAGLRGLSKRRRFTVTTERNKKDRPAPDLVRREFVADRPNQLWVADMTYVSAGAGFIYLAVVLDVWSRRVVGWQIGEEMTAQLVINALSMAGWQRKPESVIHHSDQGSQYTSLAFGKRCEELGVKPSMGTVGDAYDNAMAESFFASLEIELLKQRRFESKSQARTALFAYIEGWYNPRRRHSSIGYLSPAKFEEKHTDQFPPRVTHRPPHAGLMHEPVQRPVDNPENATITTEPTTS
jgi:putative transposase